MSRPTVIAGNWKMHKTIRDSVDFIQALVPEIKKAATQILIAPPFTAIAHAAAAAKGSSIKIGAQNMSDAQEGAFTGEVSLKMIREAGAEFVIIGHSERRTHFGETDEHIHHKIRLAATEKFPVILCIGESQSEREEGRSLEILQNQIENAFQNLSTEELKPLMIAYEPIWAIGTGKTATPELAQETHQSIRQFIANTFGRPFANQLPILYGGSVKPENIGKILQQNDIDGALIGGASLNVKSFTQMVLL